MQTLILFIYNLFFFFNFKELNVKFFLINKYINFLFYNEFTNFIEFGIDGFSYFFILLTTLLIPICILSGYNNIKIKTISFIICFLVLENMLLICFSILDLFIFYIYFEAILIPMFLIISI
jgi:NADH-quinone oxidoreductase subunit M